MEIEDAKADLANTVKSMVKEGMKSSQNPRIRAEEDEKEGEEEESSNENSSFYDEVFYDAVSENTFVQSIPEQVMKILISP